MYIDDFRSAMKHIIKKPDKYDDVFMKMDDNISNFSDDQDGSQEDVREVQRFEHPAKTGNNSPNPLETSVQSIKLEKARS